MSVWTKISMPQKIAMMMSKVSPAWYYQVVPNKVASECVYYYSCSGSLSQSQLSLDKRLDAPLNGCQSIAGVEYGDK